MISFPYILFLDTETSAKPKSLTAPAGNPDEWPHIVQIAWIITDSQGKTEFSREFIIEAKDYTIHRKSMKIHGISEEIANERGVARKEALKMLYRDLKRYNPLIVGHFIALDLNMVQVGFKRAGIKNIIKDYRSFCTMRATSDYMHLDNRQYPQLGELYQILFKKKPDHEHSAPGDANAVSLIFFELVRRGDIDDSVILGQVKDSGIIRKGKTGCGLPVMLLLVIILTVIYLL
jgi:DNA polymerase III subunit epsilon